MDTVFDIFAAKLTGLSLAKKHSADALYKAHMAHPGCAALRFAFLYAHADALIRVRK